MNENVRKYKEKAAQWFTAVDWLEIIYLILFAAFVMKKYLESTALEYEFPVWYDTVVRGGIHAYILARIYEQAVVKKAMTWKEAVLMAIMIFTGEMVTLYTGEIIVSDTLLFIIGAKGVDFKKICFVYLCVAVSIQVVALYLVNAGYVPDYVYLYMDEDHKILWRHSMGICYPTDFAAHMLFIYLVYACYRGRKITFFEMALMTVGMAYIYSTTHARNYMVCMLGGCLLYILIKILDIKKIYLSRYKFINVLSIFIIILFIGCIGLAWIYNENSEILNRINTMTANRISYSHMALEQYGIKLFGSNVVEAGLGFGNVRQSSYMFLDSSYVRILIKYGYIFAILLITMFMKIFFKVKRNGKDYIIAALLIMLVFGIFEHHLFELSFNPFWLLLFSNESEKHTLQGGMYEKIDL